MYELVYQSIYSLLMWNEKQIQIVKKFKDEILEVPVVILEKKKVEFDLSLNRWNNETLNPGLRTSLLKTQPVPIFCMVLSISDATSKLYQRLMHCTIFTILHLFILDTWYCSGQHVGLSPPRVSGSRLKSIMLFPFLFRPDNLIQWISHYTPLFKRA